MSDDPNSKSGAKNKRNQQGDSLDYQLNNQEGNNLSSHNLEDFENLEDDSEDIDLDAREAMLLKRFPAQGVHDVPDAPKIKINLPPHPDRPRPGVARPGSYKGTALAMQAASSFIMPIIVLAVLGWVLDGRLHTGVLLTVVFFIVGFAVGVANLMRVVNQMDDNHPKNNH